MTPSNAGPNVKALRWAVVLVLTVSLLSCVAKGADGPADPYLSRDAVVPTVARTPLPGFDETRISVRMPGAGVLAWCLLLAQTEPQRNRGLMEVTDPALGGYDGMLFRYEADTTQQFFMRNTPMPLSIAFVNETGTLVSTTDMAPCEDRDGCPLYPLTPLASPYRIAIEVPQGGLARLGIVPGAIVTDERTGCG